MKQKIEKAAYLCLGALIALGGYFCGTLRDDVNAQSELESQDFKTVRCQKLEIVDSEGNVLITLRENLSDEGGGQVTVVGKDGKGKVELSDDSLTIDRGLSGGIVKLSVDDDGSHVLISGKNKKGAVLLKASDSHAGGVVVVAGHSGGMAQLNGAHVVITNSSGQVVGRLYVDKAGNGIIDIRDKSGKKK